jgi:3-methyladenine DNA glycosylase AlkD
LGLISQASRHRFIFTEVDMPMEQVTQLKHKVTGYPDLRIASDLPAEFFRETSALPDEDAMELSSQLFMLDKWPYVWTAVLLMKKHPTAMKKVRWSYLKSLGERMDSWGMIDAFAALAGPAWRAGQISNARVLRWTRSPNRWWRRAALVCTVFLNRRAQGGIGDTPRTLMICEALVADRDDMVAKGLSWTLRDLSKRDCTSVENFIKINESVLPTLVKREVKNKLATGLKNPPRNVYKPN